MEVHAEYHNGVLSLLEIDLDDDGSFDRVVIGEAAESAYKALPPVRLPFPRSDANRLRFRAEGKPHGGVDPPLVLEPKPEKEKEKGTGTNQ